MTTQTKPEFNIGDKVWVVVEDGFAREDITCRDCFGKGALTVILGDDSRVSVLCEACKGRGQESVHVYRVRFYEREIEGVRRSWGELCYETGGSTTERRMIFTSQTAAYEYAKGLEAAHDKKIAETPERKVKDDKRWSWHVSYYREQIRRAERDIAYATAALAVAQKKAKES